MVKSQQDLALNPEHEFVISCIRQNYGNKEGMDVILNQTLNWEAVRQFAIMQEIFPILFHRLEDAPEKGIPPEEWAQWKDKFMSNVYRNLRLSHKLIWILGQLARNQIEAIALKGPVLAIQGYGDLSLRSFSDLDILIHPNDFHRVYDIFLKAGFKPELHLTEIQQKWSLVTDYHLPFLYQNDDVEIHWRIAEVGLSHPLKPDDFWHKLSVVSLLEAEIHTLSPENAILLACMHGTKTGWNKLKWIVDLASLIQANSQTDWSRLMEYARRNGMYRLMCLGLLLAEDPGGAELDEATHELIHGEMKAEELAARVRSQIGRNWSEPGLFGFVLFYLEARERLRDRMYIILDMLFVPKQADWISLPLPKQLYFFYYLLRPLRLLAKFGPKVLASFLNRPGI